MLRAVSLGREGGRGRSSRSMEVCGGDGYSGGLWGPSWLGREAGGRERGEGLRADLAAAVVGPGGSEKHRRAEV